jgi:hypothetical protein
MAATPVAKKCANAACSCTAKDKSKYCSAHCEGVGEKIEIMCTCGHPNCESALNS